MIKLILFPPLPSYRRIQLIADIQKRLKEKSLDDIITKLSDNITNFETQENILTKRMYRNLSLIFTLDEIKSILKERISQVLVLSYEITKTIEPLSIDGDDVDKQNPDSYGLDDWAVDHLPGADAARDFGEAMDNDGYFDWWWDWNAELDDDFFDWIRETFDDPYNYEEYGDELPPPSEPGDYNVPSKDVMYA